MFPAPVAFLASWNPEHGGATSSAPGTAWSESWRSPGGTRLQHLNRRHPLRCCQQGPCKDGAKKKKQFKIEVRDGLIVLDVFQLLFYTSRPEASQMRARTHLGSYRTMFFKKQKQQNSMNITTLCCFCYKGPYLQGHFWAALDLPLPVAACAMLLNSASAVSRAFRGLREASGGATAHGGPSARRGEVRRALGPPFAMLSYA
jgi:hypothetical protein